MTSLKYGKNVFCSLIFVNWVFKRGGGWVPVEMKGSMVFDFSVKGVNIVAVEIKGLILVLFLRKFVLFTVIVY